MRIPRFGLLCNAMFGLVCLAFLLSAFSTRSAQEQIQGEQSPANDRDVRSIVFSGLHWDVKRSAPDKKKGPGPNYWDDSNVSVDNQGRLHLRITKKKTDKGVKWFCAEVISQKSFGHGTYKWYLDTPINADPRVVVGLFTWDDDRDSARYHHREIDVELVCTWGETNSSLNAQYCVQPWTTRRNRHRFALTDASLGQSTHSFSWAADSVAFQSLRGHLREPRAKSDILQEWKFSGRGVPPPGGENVRMNFWLLSRPPDDADEIEVIISKFEFDPSASVPAAEPALEFSEVPGTNLKPGPEGTGRIAGKVSGVTLSDCKVVVYARGGDVWYVQPTVTRPDTVIRDNGAWATRTHGGDEYAALLVVKSYTPRATLATLPMAGGEILAVVRMKPN